MEGREGRQPSASSMGPYWVGVLMSRWSQWAHPGRPVESSTRQGQSSPKLLALPSAWGCSVLSWHKWGCYLSGNDTPAAVTKEGRFFPDAQHKPECSERQAPSRELVAMGCDRLNKPGQNLLTRAFSSHYGQTLHPSSWEEG